MNSLSTDSLLPSDLFQNATSILLQNSLPQTEKLLKNFANFPHLDGNSPPVLKTIPTDDSPYNSFLLNQRIITETIRIRRQSINEENQRLSDVSSSNDRCLRLLETHSQLSNGGTTSSTTSNVPNTSEPEASLNSISEQQRQEIIGIVHRRKQKIQSVHESPLFSAQQKAILTPALQVLIRSLDAIHWKVQNATSIRQVHRILSQTGSEMARNTIPIWNVILAPLAFAFDDQAQAIALQPGGPTEDKIEEAGFEEPLSESNRMELLRHIQTCLAESEYFKNLNSVNLSVSAVRQFQSGFDRRKYFLIQAAGLISQARSNQQAQNILNNLGKDVMEGTKALRHLLASPQRRLLEERIFRFATEFLAILSD